MGQVVQPLPQAAWSLCGWLVAGVTVEEVLFVGTLGLMRCSLYEHLYWRQHLPGTSP
jgi:hypothetical protein